MKLVLLTNIVSYYQVELADAFYDELGSDNFKLIVLKPLHQERVSMGWQDNYKKGYLLRYFESQGQKELAHQWISEADVVIQGRVPIALVRQRIKRGGLTFAYQERMWKKSICRVKNILRLVSLYKNYWSVDKPNYHFLAAGSFASSDVSKLGCFNGRKWQFGYFINSNSRPKNQNKSEILSLVWCGSLLKWKQPIRVIEVARELKREGYKFLFHVIGDGDEAAALKSAISENALQENVVMHGYLSKQQIEPILEAADVFLMSSNHKEGWGVVVNEAMLHSCAVIANSDAGASRCLVEEGVTGYLYEDAHFDKAINDIKRLANDTLLCRVIGQRAQQNLQDYWSSKVAAKRFVALSAVLLDTKQCNNNNLLQAQYQTLQNARSMFNKGVCTADGN